MKEWPPKEIKELDDYCLNILLLLWLRNEMRFNDLFRALNNWGMILSKPTLSDHLKHLTKKKLVSRHVKGVQNVTYALDKELIEYKNNAEIAGLGRIQTFLDEDLFTETKRSPNAQISFELNEILRMRLQELLMIIGMQAKLQKRGIDFNNPFSKNLETSLANRCMKDDALRMLVSKKIYALIALLDWLDNEEQAADKP